VEGLGQPRAYKRTQNGDHPEEEPEKALRPLEMMLAYSTGFLSFP
jgi:hypothetical protein